MGALPRGRSGQLLQKHLQSRSAALANDHMTAEVSSQSLGEKVLPWLFASVTMMTRSDRSMRARSPSALWLTLTAASGERSVSSCELSRAKEDGMSSNCLTWISGAVSKTMGGLCRAHSSSRLALVLAAMLVFGCGGTKFNKVPEGEVDGSQKAAAEKFGSSVLAAWAKDQYPKVDVPADPKFKEGQDDEAKQKAADKSIEAQMGNFQSMTYHETQKSEPAKFVIYRFKGKFSKSEAPAEVRLVYDTEGKLSGFWIKPWKDSL